MSQTFSLGDLLADADLGLELVSGGPDAGERPVSGAHVVDVATPSRWLARDWVLLTTGAQFRGDQAAQRALVGELEEAGVTALGFGIEPVYRRVPRALLETAHARAFPIFTVPPATPFRDVVACVHRALLSSEVRTYQRLSSIQRYLADALEDPEPQRVLVERLAQLTGAAVAVVLADGSAEAASGAAPATDALRERIATRPDALQELDADGWHALVVPIVAAEEGDRRWLVAAERAEAFSSPLSKPAARAAAPLLAAIHRLGVVGRRQTRAIQGALLEDLLAGGPDADTSALAARAAAFGLRFERPARVVVARPAADEVATRLEATGRPCLCVRRRDAVIVLIEAGADEIGAALEPLAGALAGAGRPVRAVADVPRSLRDAEVAVARLRRAPAAAGGQRILPFEDLDLPALLLSEVPPERIAPKVHGLLAPLGEQPVLYEALVAYFEHRLDLPRTAEALHLHPNSLRYRLGKVEHVLGRPLKDPATIAALHVALLAAGVDGDEERGDPRTDATPFRGSHD
jgi:PucR family transcriptional regulator, purine catabolism regulatory protein